MQLSGSKARGRMAAALGMLTANLLAATAAHAVPQDGSDNPGSYLNDTASQPGTTTLDTSVLFYQEQGGRVRAIEPSTAATVNLDNGDVITGRFTYDTLTGATPNGAAPWTSPQTFTTPVQALGTQQTVTSASGHSQIVTIPGTGTVVSQYTVPGNTLPVDSGFKDHRFALDLGYSHLLDPDTRISVGGAGSTESDYTSLSINGGLSHDLFGKNTTISIGGNFEFDRSRPRFGIPTPLTMMNGDIKGASQSKTVVSAIAGITQVLTRNWLVQLNYSYGSDQGYQTDPYKIVSVVDPTTGAPDQYLYESRPRSRTRQSVYAASKLAIGSAVTSASFRYYHDSWKISSITAEASETIPLGHSFYIEPGFRYYHQTAADFYAPYLLANAPTPQYASADSRLSRFSATTISLEAGYRLAKGVDLYVVGEDYKQTGTHHYANAPGALATQDFFGGVHAYSVMTGVKLSF
jgi:opacity protein-like surface antigen